jgi:membrane protease YdiL (CAAX protease family)
MSVTPLDTSRVKTIVGLGLALATPFCHLGDLGRAHSGLGPLCGGEVLWWIVGVALLIYVAAVERRPLESIGFRTPTILDLVYAIGAGTLMVIGIILIVMLLLPALHVNISKQLATVLQTPLWFRVLQVSRAAVVEEIMFRGYGMERLVESSGSRLLAAITTWLLFTAAHISSWGIGQVIIAAFGGAILTLLYVWRRNLWSNMIAHWLTDAAAFIVPHR